MRQALSKLGMDGAPGIPAGTGESQDLGPATAEIPGALPWMRQLLAWLADKRTTWWRKDRDPAMLFVDYNQNARDHTIASAYSVRGLPEATVSTPITWDEIDQVDPRQFTIATVPARFAERGDLHRGIDDTAYRLDTLLDWAERSGLDQCRH